MKVVILPTLLAILLVGCSDAPEPASATTAAGGFPELPTSSAEFVILEGKMTFWMYEGDGGCFGSIAAGAQELQLWIDADACGEKDYAENEDASVEVTFNPEHQYGPGTTYTITQFL